MKISSDSMIATAKNPVKRLPPELQDGFDPEGFVTVTIEHEEELPDWDAKAEIGKL